MKILSISNCPAQIHLGSGYVVRNFADGLRRRGHEVDLLEPDDYIICRVLGARAIGYRQAVGMWRAARTAVNRKRYDVIEFWGGESWLAVRALRSLGRNTLVVQHTNGPEPRYVDEARHYDGGHARRRLSVALLTSAFTKSDGVVTVSHGDRDWLRADRRFAMLPVEVVEPALPATMLGVPFGVRTSMRVGFCGSWLSRKGTGMMVKVATALARRWPDFRFVIAGVGDRFNASDVFPADVLRQIEVHPMIHGKERLKDYYRSLSVLIFPSLGESFGLVVPEAMSCGCAIVASRTGFPAGLINGREAIIMTQPNAMELEQRVTELLTNPDLRERIARAGWERVQRMQWDNAVSQLEQVYNRWLSEKRDGRPLSR